MAQKFDMGDQTLTVLTKQTSSSNDDLGGLVRQLVAAADPIMQHHHGAAKAAFEGFKSRVDEVAHALNSSLATILGTVSGMDRAFVEGEAQMVDDIRTAQGSADFDSARFGSR